MRALRESETEVTRQRAETERLQESTVPQAEADDLRDQLEEQKSKVKNMWHINCEQISMYHTECSDKDDEISVLRARVVEIEAAGATGHSTDVQGVSTPVHATLSARKTRDETSSSIVHPWRVLERPTLKVGRRGKPPPVDSFSSENPEDRFEDWLPTLERAAQWNGWSDEETLLQLAGHLRGKALQEWNLLTSESKTSFGEVAGALRLRIDPQNRVIAATDFRHANQTETEPVADYVRRIERLFQLAYGRDSLSAETRDTMLQIQLQGGLRYDLMRSPAVSGAQKFQELCLAARQEEKRVAELKCRQHYSSPRGNSSPETNKKRPGDQQLPTKPPQQQQQTPSSMGRKCYLCNSPLT